MATRRPGSAGPPRGCAHLVYSRAGDETCDAKTLMLEHCLASTRARFSGYSVPKTRGVALSFGGKAR